MEEAIKRINSIPLPRPLTQGEIDAAIAENKRRRMKENEKIREFIAGLDLDPDEFIPIGETQC